MNLNFFQLRSLQTRVTLFSLVIFLLGIWVLALLASQILREDMQRLLSEQQFSAASYIAKEVNNDLDERLGALEIVAGSLDQAKLTNVAALQALLEQRPVFLHLFNGGVLVLGPDGTALADVPLSTGRVGINYRDVDAVAAALTGKSTIGRPVMGRVLHAPVFGMAVPIRDAKGHVLAALYGITNLGKPNFLDKITLARYGNSGGYLLVAPQQRQIVTATDKTRIMEMLPAPGVSPWIDRFIQGYEGSTVFVNPRGTEVLASIKSVPAAGWLVAVILPTEEAFAPILAMQQRMLLVTTVFTLLAGWLIWWVNSWLLRRQLAPMLAATRALITLSETNQPPQLLPITSRDEIGALIGAFNLLLEAVAQRGEALQASEYRYRSIFENVITGIASTDRSGRLTSFNEAFRVMLGYAPAVLRRMNFADFTHPDDMALEAALFDEILAGLREHYRITKRYIASDARILWVDISVAAIRDAQGKISNFVGVIQDITERKHANAEREHVLQRIASLMKNANDCIMVLDADTRVIDISDSCLDTYGYTRVELLALRAADLRAPAVRNELPQQLRQLQERGSLSFQSWHCRKDGSSFPVEVGATMIDIDDKRYFQLIIRDVSENMRERDAMERGLAAASKRLNELSRHLVEVQEDTRRRLAGELHDRTSPNLAAIQINLGMIASTLPQDPPPRHSELFDYLADTRALIEDTENSVRDICADLRSPILDYAGLVPAMEAYASRYAQRTGIAVQVACVNAEKRLALALESLLFRIFQEALTNSLKHAQPQSIQVQADLASRPVVLSIADDGSGFDLGQLGTHSSGMGLLNMREMAEFAGGTLLIETHPGKGTHIEVRIQV